MYNTFTYIYPPHFSVVSNTNKYCYNTVTCNGGHPDGIEGLAGFGECCGGGGRSWGLSDGHDLSSCQPCPIDGDFAGDPSDMLKPSGNINKYYIAQDNVQLFCHATYVAIQLKCKEIV
jgi:hypothetical protein